GHRIERRARGKLRDRVGDDSLHGLAGARTANLDLAHVRDVEDACGLPDGAVLVEDPGRVLHVHCPPAKIADAGPERLMRHLAAPVERTVALLDGGATVSFVARYRKEQTGELDEVQIGRIRERAEYLRELAERKRTIVATLAEQGELTDALRKEVEAAATKQVL